jgi:hypothetical protein
MTKSLITVYDLEEESFGFYTEEVFVSEYEERSELLGPNGKRLLYKERPSLGFDLRSRKACG